MFPATILEAFSAKRLQCCYAQIFLCPWKDTTQEKRAPNEKINDFSKATQKINIRIRKTFRSFIRHMSFSEDNTYLYLLTSTAELPGNEQVISEKLRKHADGCLLYNI